jgi:hypothetical protein
MIEEENIQSLSQLLRLKCAKRNSNILPTYYWTGYFKKDYTFSPYMFRKYLKENGTSASVAVRNDGVYTARDLRNDMLLSMIKLHNSLYEESSDYKGIPK